jgi:hypothetical protein
VSAPAGGQVAAPVRFGRLDRRGLILGLSTAQTAAVALAVLVVTGTAYGVGAAGVLATAPVWAGLLGAALVPVAGRPVLGWLPLVGQRAGRRLMGHDRYLTDPTSPGPADVLRLPGAPGALRVLRGPRTGAALVHDAGAGTLTAVLEVAGSGFVLDDAAGQDRRVTGWGRVLGGLCQQPAVRRVQVLARSVPDGGAQVRRWWAEHGLASAGWAAQVVAEVVADAAGHAERRECFLAVAVRADGLPGRPGVAVRRPRARRAVAAAEQVLDAVADAVRAAELDVPGWVGPAWLGGIIRAAYDPAVPRPVPLSEDNVVVAPGPAGLMEDWASVRSDSAYHAVYWVAEWPRSEAHPGFLQPLLLAPGTRRALSIVAEPVPPARALRDIRRAKVEHAADAAQRARLGQVEDEATRAQAAELLRREQDLVAGHGDLRFVGLLAVSAPSAEELSAACAATEAAAGQALCEVRRLVGQQAQAYAAAALPLARGLR